MAALPPQVVTALSTLVDESGAISSSVVDRDGRVVALRGQAPATEILLIPSADVLAQGPVSARSSSGEVVVIAALEFGGAVLVAVFPGQVPDSSARAAVSTALRTTQKSELH